MKQIILQNVPADQYKDQTWGKKVEVLVFEPDNCDHAKKYPTIIFARGYGEQGLAAAPILTTALPQLLHEGMQIPFIVVCLQAAAWGIDQQTIGAQWPEILQRMPWIDQDNLFITGISAGSSSVLEWLVTAGAPTFRAAYIVSPARIPADKEAQLRAVSIPVIFSVGDQDDFYKNTVIPYLGMIPRSDAAIIQGAGHSAAAWNIAYSLQTKVTGGDNWVDFFSKNLLVKRTEPLPPVELHPSGNVPSSKKLVKTIRIYDDFSMDIV